MGRCSGHCCDYFALGGPPSEVDARIERTAARVAPDDPRLAEWRQIRAMVRYRGLVTNPNRPGTPPDYWYTCEHYDRATGDCGIYETRPAMCRAYPNGKPCPNAGCTLGAPVGPTQLVPRVEKH